MFYPYKAVVRVSVCCFICVFIQRVWFFTFTTLNLLCRIDYDADTRNQQIKKSIFLRKKNHFSMNLTTKIELSAFRRVNIDQLCDYDGDTRWRSLKNFQYNTIAKCFSLLCVSVCVVANDRHIPKSSLRSLLFWEKWDFIIKSVSLNSNPNGAHLDTRTKRFIKKLKYTNMVRWRSHEIHLLFNIYVQYL